MSRGSLFINGTGCETYSTRATSTSAIAVLSSSVDDQLTFAFLASVLSLRVTIHGRTIYVTSSCFYCSICIFIGSTTFIDSGRNGSAQLQLHRLELSEAGTLLISNRLGTSLHLTASLLLTFSPATVVVFRIGR